LAGYPLKQLRRSVFAQRQQGRDLEAGIDGAGNPMQFSSRFKGGQKTAHALVGHD
jgi:hypothetical protein